MSSTKEWTNIFNIPAIMVRFWIPKNLWYPQMTFKQLGKLAFSTVFSEILLFVSSWNKIKPRQRSENDKNKIRIKFNIPAITYGNNPNSKFQKSKYLWYPQMTFKLLENLLIQRFFWKFFILFFYKKSCTVFSRVFSWFSIFSPPTKFHQSKSWWESWTNFINRKAVS